ncbi:MAG: exodeoxyribonuclease III [Euryarchaeota archaeon]|nr:exodeoxyribonuclease III [Euryarchaeota archaeon]MBV1728970.1 exodeoxyribonuclease III [Methanobacterium sp.]MBU4547624.1 exodeoxyribonuclease III [Euryarchaeota archaeon]MBU4607833.1 exodeoxyribonuclease III [Euryarchaeota archaeon]MBV1754172.1 exodeoxyribonuclease III [Methanobacterium sp.]
MKNIRIVSWNVNGIRAIHRKGFLNWLNKDKPDILCIQETKATPDQLPRTLKEINGYHVYFNSAERKGYSGVALYSSFKPENIENGFGIDKFDREGRIQIADYGEFVLFNIYFPNGKMSEERLKYKLEFYDAFLDYANQLRDQGKNIIVCGDLNTAHKEIDLARPKENSNISGFLPVERAWIDKFLDNGYVDTFRMFNSDANQYTWWSYRTRARERNVGWRLDYFFANKEFTDRIESSYILYEVMGSDHSPVALDIKI